MSHASRNRIEILIDRAKMLKASRHFFEKRGVLEVDVPILSLGAPIDAYIECIEASVQGKKAFMHTSPEYGMKRLLAEGIGDIYQLSHVFRDGEVGERHNPEFVMVEWYRVGMPFDELIEETTAYLQLFLPRVKVKETLTYAEAFEKYASKRPKDEEEEDEILAFEVEPKLGQGGFTVIRDFPLHRAALAQVGEKGVERFEIFYRAMELANGYHELRDPIEQKKRLKKSNQKRKSLGKPIYPEDKEFLAALEKGLPDSVGVAVGFERLMMLRHKVEHIEAVLPFAWRES